MHGQRNIKKAYENYLIFFQNIVQCGLIFVWSSVAHIVSISNSISCSILKMFFGDAYVNIAEF